MIKKVPNQWFTSSMPHIISSTVKEEPTPSRHQNQFFIREGINISDTNLKPYHFDEVNALCETYMIESDIQYVLKLAIRSI